MHNIWHSKTDDGMDVNLICMNPFISVFSVYDIDKFFNSLTISQREELPCTYNNRKHCLIKVDVNSRRGDDNVKFKIEFMQKDNICLNEECFLEKILFQKIFKHVMDIRDFFHASKPAL